MAIMFHLAFFQEINYTFYLYQRSIHVMTRLVLVSEPNFT